MRTFPHTKRNHRSGNWVYFRRYPLRAQAVIGRVFFERSLRTADRSKIADSWTIAHQAFESVVRQACDKPLSLLARASTTTNNEEIIDHSVLDHFRVWDGDAASTFSKLDIDFNLLLSNIKTWGDQQRYERAERFLNDPTYTANDENFRLECKDVGACGEACNWTLYSPKLYDLSRKLLSIWRIEVPAMHGVMHTIERLIENELKDVLEAEGRWRLYDLQDMPRTNPANRKVTGLAPNGEPFMALTELIDKYILTTRKPKKTSSKLHLVSRYIEEITEAGVTLDKINKSVLLRLQTEAKLLPARPNAKEKSLKFVDAINHAQSFEPPRPRLTPQAIQAWFNLLGGCFSWAVRTDHMQHDPSQGVKPTVRTMERKRRKPLTTSDINHIFGSKSYCRDINSSKFWLPILALYTGARLNELGQLLKEDIRLDPIPHINITDDANKYGAKKRLKNSSSKRVVPIHSHLIDIGFVEFCRSSLGPHVFMYLPHYGEYEPTKAYSQWFGRYLRGSGILDPLKVFHSFRHSFKDECRRAGIEEEVHDALTGHSGTLNRIGRAYGSGVPLETMHRAVNLLYLGTAYDFICKLNEIIDSNSGE